LGGILGQFFGGFFGFLLGLMIGFVVTGWDKTKSISTPASAQDLQYQNAQRARVLIGERTD
jgi:hypothetical protein